MALLTLLEGFSSAESALIILVTTSTVFSLAFLINRAFFGPLAVIPGPLICRFTSLWLWYHTYIGDNCTTINNLHKKYGPVIRIGPNDCAIADGAALAPLYSEKGGFMKAACYSSFNIEGHFTLFSTSDPEYRGKRAKAVTSLFSTANIRAQHDLFERCVDRFLIRLQKETVVGRPLDILTLCRRLALDSLSTYLFKRDYGSLAEPSKTLSAAIFVDSSTAIGRFFFLPTWLFELVELTRQRYFASEAEVAGISIVDKFGDELSSNAVEDGTTFQGRLQNIDLSEQEVALQCKDLIFAGTDSTGTVLASTIWHLCRSPAAYQTLRQEVAEADTADPTLSYNPQSLKYLDAVVREGLRLGKANPERFPRVVPSNGWIFAASNGRSYQVPGGTIVGCAPMTLHENPDVFIDPHEFIPERWLDNPTPQMFRDLIPFNIGPRQCIARNLAQYELLLALRALARNNTLDGFRTVADQIEVIEWFNARIIPGTIDIVKDK